MTDFLFIPATNGASLGRRVDFASIASLFAEIDEPAPAKRPRKLGLQLTLSFLILLAALGDMVLIARPDALAASLMHSLVVPKPTKA